MLRAALSLKTVGCASVFAVTEPTTSGKSKAIRSFCLGNKDSKNVFLVIPAK